MLLFETLTELLSDFDVVPCDKHIKNDVFLNKKKLRTLFIIKKGMKLLLGIFLFMKQKKCNKKFSYRKISLKRRKKTGWTHLLTPKCKNLQLNF